MIMKTTGTLPCEGSEKSTKEDRRDTIKSNKSKISCRICNGNKVKTESQELHGLSCTCSIFYTFPSKGGGSRTLLGQPGRVGAPCQRKARSSFSVL